MAGIFDESKHKRGTGAQGGQFVSKGASSAGQTLGYDAKKGTGAGYGTAGGKGDNNVKSLQTYLNNLGFKDSDGNPLKVDGKLGPRTTSAVKRLQRKLGVKPDGLVTPSLLHKLRQASLKKGKGGVAKKTVPQKARKTAPAKKTTAPGKRTPAPAPGRAQAPKPRAATGNRKGM